MGEIPIYPSKEKERVAEPRAPLFSPDAIAGVSELARHYERRQMQDDLVTALGAEQTYTQWQDQYLDHLETGFLARRGADAKGGYEAFQEEAERTYLALNDGLENSNQRALFQSRFQDRMQQAQDRIAAHEARELDVLRRAALGDASITEARRAVDQMKQGDAVGAADRLDMAGRFLGQSVSGLPTEQKDQAQRMLANGYHSEVFAYRLEDDPEGASQYLVANQNDIDPVIFERLFQQATDKTESAEGQALFESVYAPEVDLSVIIQAIDASDAPAPQKAIARVLAEDRNLAKQAEQIGFAKQHLQIAEQAALSAVQQIDQGTAFDQVVDEIKSQLSPEHRKAVQAVYLQRLSGEAARRNEPLELELHQSWIRFVNGDSDGFLELPLASHYGTHNRVRLNLWIERQAQLKRGGPAILAELSRRKFAFNKATTLIVEAVAQRTAGSATQTRMQGQLDEAAITHINHWHETNLGQMMEPKAVVDMLAVMVGLESQDRTLQPHIDDFAALNDQPDVALTDTEQGLLESEGSLPDAVTKALQEPRMDEWGIWFDKDENALTDEQGYLINKDGELLRDGDGNGWRLLWPSPSITANQQPLP